MKMILSDSTLAELCEHAAAEYPRECCGMIHQSGRVRRCRNIDPRPDRFEFSAADVVALFESQSTTDPITALYHSHPDAPAAWSKADATGAQAVGDPLAEALTWLVIECRKGRPMRIVSSKWHSSVAAAETGEVPGALRGPKIGRVSGVFHSSQEVLFTGLANWPGRPTEHSHNCIADNGLVAKIGKTPYSLRDA